MVVFRTTERGLGKEEIIMKKNDIIVEYGYEVEGCMLKVVRDDIYPFIGGGGESPQSRIL